MAKGWLSFIEDQVLLRVIPEHRDGWARTQIHAFVTPEFDAMLEEIARERGRPLSPRITREIMAYDYPDGETKAEAGRSAANHVKEARNQLEQPVGPAFSLEPGEDPSLYKQLRKGTAREVVLGALKKSGTKDQPVFFQVPHHHTLISGAPIIDPQSNIRALFINSGEHGARLGIEAVRGIVVTDFFNHTAGNGGNIHINFCTDFSGHQNKSGGHQRFASHATHGIFFQNSIQNSIGDLIRDFVGMPFGHGLGSE
jgi:hypothetical protein